MSDLVSRIDRLRHGGDLFAAYDLAMQAVQDGADDPAIRHRAVLCLARSGALHQAVKLFDELALDGLIPGDAEIAALSARLTKDRALRATGPERRGLLHLAATQYEAIFHRTGGYYPGVNAATLNLLSGRGEAAAALAASVVEICAAGDDDDAYYRLASLAEARLLLGETEAAARALEQARAAGAGRYDDMAGTRRQLRLICDAAGTDAGVLAALAAPRVAHYCGHRMSAATDSGRLRPDDEAAVAAAIAARLDADDVGALFGSLASGADILFVEAALATDRDVHLVLPFGVDDFVRVSVADSGAGWTERFHRCLAHPRVRQSFVTEDPFRGHPLIFAYATQYAMGLALLRARHLGARPLQLAVWDGRETGGDAGTAADVGRWRALGHDSAVIAPPSAAGPAPAAAQPSEPAVAADFRIRELKALVFGDVKGFSKMRDDQVPLFVENVLGPLRAVMHAYDDDSLEFRNTWGDGLFLVFADVATAARCALELQATLAALPFKQVGLPDGLSLRIGCHLGPVFVMPDPVTGRTGYFGGHVNKAARIEPITPPEEVYVSEAFAAHLALNSDDYLCEYVGDVASAKDYGRFRMYLLRAA